MKSNEFDDNIHSKNDPTCSTSLRLLSSFPSSHTLQTKMEKIKYTISKQNALFTKMNENNIHCLNQKYQNTKTLNQTNKLTKSPVKSCNTTVINSPFRIIQEKDFEASLFNYEQHRKHEYFPARPIITNKSHNQTMEKNPFENDKNHIPSQSYMSDSKDMSHNNAFININQRDIPTIIKKSYRSYKHQCQNDQTSNTNTPNFAKQLQSSYCADVLEMSRQPLNYLHHPRDLLQQQKQLEDEYNFNRNGDNNHSGVKDENTIPYMTRLQLKRSDIKRKKSLKAFQQQQKIEEANVSNVLGCAIASITKKQMSDMKDCQREDWIRKVKHKVCERKLNRAKMRMDYNDTIAQEYAKRQLNVLSMRDHLEEGLQKLKAMEQRRIKQIQSTKRTQPLQISAHFKRISIGYDINHILDKKERQYCPYFHDYCHNDKIKTCKQKYTIDDYHLPNESRDYNYSLFFPNSSTFKEKTQIKEELHYQYRFSDDDSSNDDYMNTANLQSRSKNNVKGSNDITISQQAAERIYGRLKR